MKSNAKSSITLPSDELKQVERLRKALGAKSKVEVIRKGLRLLSEQTDREELRKAYQRASASARGALKEELAELDPLSGEGIENS